MLPALLQVFDSVKAQHRFGTQRLGFVDHGFAARNALGARGFQRCVGGVHGGLPERLDFCKRFFAQMPGVLPFFNKAIQAADVHFPVCAGLVSIGPGRDFVDQQLALGFDGFGLLLDGFQPGLDHLVGFVAGIVKALPQRMVGRAALVRCFPQVAHVAQRVLLLAATEWLDQQRLGLADQLFANLVCTPALPAFQFTSSGERGMGGGL